MVDALGMMFPRLAARLPKISIANLPTPLREYSFATVSPSVTVLVKHDDLSNEQYGGNKIRKLEYLLQRARERDATRVATFGTVASNHALATSIHARQLGLDCTCFLSHQARTDKAALALNLHLQQGTEIVRFGGDRTSRVQTLRRHLQHRHAWVIPMGGSNWLGVIGFVNAGLELALQLEDAGHAAPDHLYVANGTMGTAAGLAIGLALAGLATEIQAVRVTHAQVANPAAMQRLIAKTVTMMRRLDMSIPADVANRVKLRFRDAFFAAGYARTDATTERAIAVARAQLGLTLDATYTGKAMAALLSDLENPAGAGSTLLFWNTYHARALPVSSQLPADTSALPQEFLRYYV
ncbi:MAG: pyridoxal-phosphate dependent enzyme [Gammaproteobacteria bacterium]|nr:pyridoxal-phosphate dependent enzyme [Gammaproteobacteria bacterium]MDH5323412.1 pyridoxal-phosphate dependent enzyme [Gammaproteobacteria bacterium]